MIFLYNLSIQLYHFAVWVASAWNPKARLWIRGRKGLIPMMAKAMGSNTDPVIWMHCASLGEFEQGRPVLELLRKEYPRYKILLTFYSPSGFEIRKNYPGADFIFYLPSDTPWNAKMLLEIAKPDLAIFVKYDFWYHYLSGLRKRQVPTLLLSARFRENHIFFKPYGGFWRNMLQFFHAIFLQDQASANLVNKYQPKANTITSGDTRFDRVLQIASGQISLPLIEKFCNGRKTVVAGSTWIEDEEVMDHYARSHPEYCFVIAPHEIHESRMREIEKLFVNTIRYSDWEKEHNNGEPKAHVLIIDNIGMLSRLYHYAEITYVGGAFGGDGIHNILEAVVYFKPVVFGPVFDKFPEAIDLVDLGGAETVENALELENVFNTLMEDGKIRENKGRIAGTYIRENAGATKIVMNYIQEKRLLTN